ncbi:hypothetical protein [Eggerthella lenta]|uniref:hypothetical protein n=1 Tax=Eggerthella lenta TaxID=84112 RepID=UPI0022E74CAC|nr:hypothetical protein [Eggerthella lenta]
MRIIDENGAEVENPDLDLGRLVPERILVAHHDGVPEKPRIEEEGEPIWQNPDDPDNALVPIVVVQEYEPAIPAWDEHEDVMRYVRYTQAELDEIAARRAEEEAERAAAEEAAAEAERKRAEREAIVDGTPARFESLETAQLDHDEAITGLYESMTAAQLDADEALVTLYEMIAAPAAQAN